MCYNYRDDSNWTSLFYYFIKKHPNLNTQFQLWLYNYLYYQGYL